MSITLQLMHFDPPIAQPLGALNADELYHKVNLLVQMAIDQSHEVESSGIKYLRDLIFISADELKDKSSICIFSCSLFLHNFYFLILFQLMVQQLNL